MVPRSIFIHFKIINMLVEITKRHCIDASYLAIKDCPMFRAIKEQHPEFDLASVSGDFIRDSKNNIFKFDANMPFDILTGKDIRTLEEVLQRQKNKEAFWNSTVMIELLNGSREGVIIYIHTPEYDLRKPVYSTPVKMSHYERGLIG
jgi:hypothetical protein